MFFLSGTGKKYREQRLCKKPDLPPFKEIAKKGKSDFVGAVTDGQFGAAAFDFKSVHDPLKARKSWFFFDREYVCLGTGINSQAEFPVATTLNQCLLNKDVVVKSKGAKKTLDKGQHELKDVSWVLHDSIAYVFPSPASVNVSNATATGNWKLISHQASASDETVKKDLFTLWFNHGQKPLSAGYSYIVIPKITPSAVESYTKKPEIAIIANTVKMQAVQHKGLKLTEAVFYEPGTLKINGTVAVTVGSPCIATVKMGAKGIEKIAVSDPTQKLKSIQLKVTTPVTGSGNNWSATWDKENKVSVIQIDLPAGGNAGKSAVLTL